MKYLRHREHRGHRENKNALTFSFDEPRSLAYNKNRMPTVLRIGRHRFFFFSREDNEPPHIHVESAENAAKFWLRPVALEWAVGYNSKEIGQLRKLVEENSEFFLEKWYEYDQHR